MEGRTPQTFENLGLDEALCDACKALGFTRPIPIQAQVIPVLLKEQRDVVGTADTGSGKTAAYALPILHALVQNPSTSFGLVLVPTRELAYQVSQQFDALGSIIGVRCAVVVGGMDFVSQAVALSKKPHIIVATPGRLLDHLENTKGFRLRTKFLVLDEADRLLDLDFGPIITKVLQSVPAERRSLLFSATMPKNVAALVRASLRNPVKISISSSLHQEISTLSQSFLLVPHKHKDIYIVQRLGALSRFKTQGESGRNILVATDVASRGLDLPSVSFVFNYDFPLDSAMYIHRVGRTARAGQSGQAISLVTQYDREMFLRLEHVLQRKIAEFPVVKEEAMVYSERVGEAQKLAARQLRLQSNKSQRRRGGVKRGNGNSRGGNVRGTVRDSMDLDEG